jgi:hypothetical protein
MSLAELLLQKRDAIARRWMGDALQAYAADSSALFGKEKDPFGNPVGHSLRQGTRGVVEAVLEGRGAEDIRRHLQEMIKIRAVQQMPPSQAVGFVFSLKQAIRAELGDAAGSAEHAVELARLDGQIDRIALMAFDVYTQCREQVSELRINEVKRSVSWVVDRINQGAASRGTGSDRSATKSKDAVNVRREGAR